MNKLAVPLGDLQRHVAGEAVRDDHVDDPLRNVVPFDEAAEVDRQPAVAQHRRRPAHDVVALELLGPDAGASATLGLPTPSITPANTSPITANWNRFSEPYSTLAPRSSITTGRWRAGSTEAIAGRSTPGKVFSTNFAIAIKVPVFPAETAAAASPSFTALTASRMLEPCSGAGHAPASRRRHRVRGVPQARPLGQSWPRRHQRLELLAVAEQNEREIQLALQRQCRALDHDPRGRVAAHAVEGDRQVVPPSPERRPPVSRVARPTWPALGLRLEHPVGLTSSARGGPGINACAATPTR